MNSFKQSVNEVNKDLKGFFDIFLKWGPHILKLISSPSVKNMMPGWIMAAVAAMGALFTEGAVAAAAATAAAAGGVAAAAGAGVAAAAYATLIGVYAGLQFAGPTTPALFLVAFELAIARLPLTPVRQVTASFGATMIEHGDDFDSVLHRVDRALYAAKEQGGNRVVLLPDGPLEVLAVASD